LDIEKPRNGEVIELLGAFVPIGWCWFAHPA
jgi:ribosomal protein S16